MKLPVLEPSTRIFEDEIVVAAWTLVERLFFKNNRAPEGSPDPILLMKLG
jgi:hypothetical protein